MNMKILSDINKFDVHSQGIVHYSERDGKIILRTDHQQKEDEYYYFHYGILSIWKSDNPQDIRSINFLTQSKILVAVSNTGIFKIDLCKSKKIVESQLVSPDFENVCIRESDFKDYKGEIIMIARKSFSCFELLKFDPCADQFYPSFQKEYNLNPGQMFFNIKSIDKFFYINTLEGVQRIVANKEKISLNSVTKVSTDLVSHKI